MADAVSTATQKLFDQYAVQAQAKTPTKALGKDDFLRLLTTQMKYQDPTQPMDNKEMAAQLAQFSSLEQLQNLNTAMDKLTNTNSSLAQSLAQMSLPAMISKTVKANTNAISSNGKDPVSFGYSLPGKAGSVRVEIRDANDKVIRAWDTAPTTAGENNFSWDGKNATGIMQASGNYKFVVTAKDTNGSDMSVSPIVRGKVTGVRYTGTDAFVIVNGAEVAANSIIEVSE